MPRQQQLDYRAIAEKIRAGIADDTYPVGTKLPPLHQLQQTYEAARDTIRDAENLLAREGLVVPRRGIGTIVRDTSPIALTYDGTNPSPSWSEQTGGEETVVEAEWDTVDHAIAARLRVEPGTRAVRRVRHMSINGTVVQIHEQWIPELVVEAIKSSGGGDLADPTAAHHGIKTLLDNAGYGVTGQGTVEEKLYPRVPRADEADTLEIPETFAVQVAERIFFTADDQPVETATIVRVGDRSAAVYRIKL